MNHLASFYQPFNSNQQRKGYMATTPTAFPGGSTDASIGLSIFDLPAENLRKLQRGEKEIGQDDKNKKG